MLPPSARHAAGRASPVTVVDRLKNDVRGVPMILLFGMDSSACVNVERPGKAAAAQWVASGFKGCELPLLARHLYRAAPYPRDDGLAETTVIGPMLLSLFIYIYGEGSRD